tara:strand:- start:96 stop:284 length:189 start_codon:yes stop_codon:yes gene_type:complete
MKNKINNMSDVVKINIWTENTASQQGNSISSSNGFFGIRMSSWGNPETAPPVVTTKAGEAMT